MTSLTFNDLSVNAPEVWLFPPLLWFKRSFKLPFIPSCAIQEPCFFFFGGQRVETSFTIMPSFFLKKKTDMMWLKATP
jgi:hypothetical protein